MQIDHTAICILCKVRKDVEDFRYKASDTSRNSVCNTCMCRSIHPQHPLNSTNDALSTAFRAWATATHPENYDGFYLYEWMVSFNRALV